MASGLHRESISAAAVVFGNGYLLEKVFLLLPVADALLLQRINKTTFSNHKGSNPLRRHLFLEAEVDCEPRLNPLLGRFFKLAGVAVTSQFPYFDPRTNTLGFVLGPCRGQPSSTDLIERILAGQADETLWMGQDDLTETLEMADNLDPAAARSLAIAYFADASPLSLLPEHSAFNMLVSQPPMTWLALGSLGHSTTPWQPTTVQHTSHYHIKRSLFSDAIELGHVVNYLIEAGSKHESCSTGCSRRLVLHVGAGEMTKAAAEIARHLTN